MIERTLSEYVRKMMTSYPVVTITGPRQSGKTTLVRHLFPQHEYQNLEAEDVLAIAKSDPRAFLGQGERNMVVVEAIKSRLNRGLEPDCWFYRNSSGSIEVDLIMEEGGKLYPKEIKSSSTFTPDMSDHLKTLCSMTPNAVHPIVVYTGETRSGIAVNYADTDAWC